jgi:hypothetical protein
LSYYTDWHKINGNVCSGPKIFGWIGVACLSMAGPRPPGPEARPALVPGGGLASKLEAWAAAARIDEAALARGRQRWMMELASQEATLGGVLLDLGERRARVSVRVSGDRTHTGRIEVIGADFVSLRAARGVVLVPHRSVAVVRTAPEEPTVVGDRALRSGVGFDEVIRELAADREVVRLVLAGGGEVLAGALRSAGVDVLALRTDGDPPATVHVPLAAISEVALG